MKYKSRALVSSMTAQRIPVFSMAALRLSRVSWWYSWDPCEKLKRATFMPARRSFSTIGTERDAGPSVHTIFVLGLFSAWTVVAISALVPVFLKQRKPLSLFFNQKNTQKSRQDKKGWDATLVFYAPCNPIFLFFYFFLKH